ncbi:MAG TPA: OsmC family protein [Gemmatimonadales bacterium]|nr:OsmC family protein [Gemmatimonadales bacterium]
MAAPTAEITMRWTEQLRFEGGASQRPAILVDGDSQVATSPVELLLLAAATCTASDVVLILQKQRVRLAALEVAVRGTRRETQPRRYTAIDFHFTVRGEGADETKARRAVDLSLEKYCSVVASLAPDIRISYDLTVA